MIIACINDIVEEVKRVFNYNKLKAKMMLADKKPEDLSAALGINISTFYRKANNNGNFTRNEIVIISQFLNLCDTEMQEIFFDE